MQAHTPDSEGPDHCLLVVQRLRLRQQFGAANFNTAAAAPLCLGTRANNSPLAAPVHPAALAGPPPLAYVVHTCGEPSWQQSLLLVLLLLLAARQACAELLCVLSDMAGRLVSAFGLQMSRSAVAHIAAASDDRPKKRLCGRRTVAAILNVFELSPQRC